ncbi:hypothetical protein INT47_009598 [Mucor saturninus]|uniref:Ubiquitin-like domain-containing protein n=1 Tax=Mucor saturninus TaxID=64648 RepID=A0A8H7QJF1_9FUNG|nr:hypothetical protein INT47_009598 [Mucor saturninus]
MNDQEFTDIHLRWNNGIDLVLTVLRHKDNIGEIKQLIRRNAIEQTSKKTIRLIHRGQLLKDDERTLADYGIESNRIFIHCALSDPIIPTNTITSTETHLQKKTVAGFDKLSESGYNDEEIRSIRTQFHSHASPDYIDGEPPNEHEISLEEQWMEHSGTMLPEQDQSSVKEMMCGLLLGFFLGVLCLFWVKESVFTRRHQMGIVAGMLINVSCGVIHVFY